MIGTLDNDRDIIVSGSAAPDSASNKTAELKRTIYNKVKYQLEEKKIFLDANLSLVRFSSIVGTNITSKYGTKRGVIGG